MNYNEKITATVDELGKALRQAEEQQELVRKNERLSALGKQEEIKKIADELEQQKKVIADKLKSQLHDLRKEAEPKVTTSQDDRLKAIQILTATGSNTTAEIFEMIAEPLKGDAAALKQLKVIVENVGCKSNIEGTKAFEILGQYERLEKYTEEAERLALDVLAADRTGARYGISKNLLQQALKNADNELKAIKGA